MDLSWNLFSCGGLFMSAPGLVEKLRKQQCPLSRQFLTALSLCHTVMAQWKKGCVFVRVCAVSCFCDSDQSSSLLVWLQIKLPNLRLYFTAHWFIIDEISACDACFHCVFILHRLSSCCAIAVPIYVIYIYVANICNLTHFLSNVHQNFKADAFQSVICQPVNHQSGSYMIIPG